MELFFIVVICFLAGFNIGWKVRELYATHKLRAWMEQAQEEYDEEEDDLIQVHLEKHNDILFCYDKETNRFMTQANSRDELEKKLSEMHPGKRFAVSPEDLKEVGFKK